MSPQDLELYLLRLPIFIDCEDHDTAERIRSMARRLHEAVGATPRFPVVLEDIDEQNHYLLLRQATDTDSDGVLRLNVCALVGRDSGGTVFTASQIESRLSVLPGQPLARLLDEDCPDDEIKTALIRYLVERILDRDRLLAELSIRLYRNSPDGREPVGTVDCRDVETVMSEFPMGEDVLIIVHNAGNYLGALNLETNRSIDHMLNWGCSSIHGQLLPIESDFTDFARFVRQVREIRLGCDRQTAHARERA